MNTDSCPISGVKTDENKARIFAALVIFIVASFILSKYILLITLLNIEFFLKGFISPKDSITTPLLKFISKKIQLKEKPIDAAPKIFSAKIGFVMTLGIIFSALFVNYTTSFSFSGVLIFFAFLEAAFGFCTGCYIYRFIKKF
jgi:hypothetical protein